jgi:ABC-type bacteriocin/lantibiotic exporter with double-glycine peptidase domain
MSKSFPFFHQHDAMDCGAPLPAIVHWKQSHFVVVYEIKIAERRTQNAKKILSCPEIG